MPLVKAIIIGILFASVFMPETDRRRKWIFPAGAILLAAWILAARQPLTPLLAGGIAIAAAWVSLVFLVRRMDRSFAKALRDIEGQIESKTQNIRSLLISDEVILEESKVLQQSLSQKEVLYEALEELNSTLEFSKTVEAFSRLVSRLSSFESGWLVTLVQDGSNTHELSSYQLFRDEPPLPLRKAPEEALSAYQRGILSSALKSRTPVFVSNPDETMPHSAGLAKPSITGIRLSHEEQPIGALILEGCKKRELEALEVLAIQLSMIIQRSRLYEKVLNLSIFDHLTQTYQRRHMMALLSHEICRLSEQGKSCSILMADIDHFKGFNDNFGHLTGDILLRELALCLQSNLRPMDLVCRYGGEEFLMVLPETTAEEAFQIAQRIRSDIQTRNFIIHDKLFKLTISIGISLFPRHSTDLMQLLNLADRALYRAKDAGRNQVKMHENDDKLNDQSTRVRSTGP